MLRRVVVLLTLVASLQSACACECAEVSKRDAFKFAAIVFRGRVAGIEHMNPILPAGPIEGRVKLVPIPRATDDETLVTFRVTAAWKGPATTVLKVYATARPSMCDGYNFRENVEYVVYAANDLDQHRDWLKPFSNGAIVYDIPDCPIRVRTDVLAEVDRLGPGRRPK